MTHDVPSLLWEPSGWRLWFELVTGVVIHSAVLAGTMLPATNSLPSWQLAGTTHIQGVVGGLLTYPQAWQASHWTTTFYPTVPESWDLWRKPLEPTWTIYKTIYCLSIIHLNSHHLDWWNINLFRVGVWLQLIPWRSCYIICGINVFWKLKKKNVWILKHLAPRISAKGLGIWTHFWFSVTVLQVLSSLFSVFPTALWGGWGLHFGKA